MKTPIKNFKGQIKGYVEEDSNGNRTVYDFYHRVLGKYNKQTNTSHDFYGRIIAHGDVVMSLIDLR